MKKLLYESLQWSKALIFAVILSILLTVFIVQPFTVSGSSMEPTLEGKDEWNKDKIGDKVMVFKSPYLLGVEPKFGEVVIVDSNVEEKLTMKDQLLESPIIRTISNASESIDHYWVKRVIGEAGDTLEGKNGIVYRNGEPLDEKEINIQGQRDFGPVSIEEGYIFVMGDNRNKSHDSRNIGPIPIENVIGKVVMRFYPFDKISLIK